MEKTSNKMSYWSIPGVKYESGAEKANYIITNLSKSVGVDIRQRTRLRNVCEARQVSMYMIRMHTGLSLQAIGRLYACKGNEQGFDHASVMHAINNVSIWLEGDMPFRKKWKNIINMEVGAMSRIEFCVNETNEEYDTRKILIDRLPKVCSDCVHFNLSKSLCEARLVTKYATSPSSVNFCLRVAKKKAN